MYKWNKLTAPELLAILNIGMYTILSLLCAGNISEDGYSLTVFILCLLFAAINSMIGIIIRTGKKTMKAGSTDERLNAES